MYKIYTRKPGMPNGYIHKLWLIMRLTVVLLIATIMQVSATGFAQRVTLDEKKVTFEKVFKEMHNQTGYDFMYNRQLLNKKQKVDIKANNESLESVLEKLLEGQSLEFSIAEKIVVIREKAPSFLDRIIDRFQAIDVTGKVTDETGKPIAGATIKVKGTSVMTNSNAEGIFVLENVSEDAMIEISYVGYQTKDVNVKKDLGTIALKIDIGKLDEVQVIGYGVTTQRLSTGSVSRISAKEIEQQPVTNVLSALSGRMPGVFVQTTNGLPGGNINVQIRGKGSIAAGTNPLYIIDGVPYDSSPVGQALLAGNNIAGTISPLNNINPSDIESITVLKDADATSIYGSRGANSVILIKTKSAETGATRFNVHVQNGQSRIATGPQLLSLNEYLSMRKEAFQRAGQVPSSDPNNSYYAPDLTLYDQTTSTNWADYIYGGSSNYTDLQSTLSSGNQQLSFKINGNYRKENTVLPGDNDYHRGGLTVQIMHRSANNKFDLHFSSQLSLQNNNISNASQGIGNINLAPNFLLSHPDGSYNWDAYANIAAAMQARSKTKINHTISNISAGYQFSDAFKLSTSAGYTKATYDQSLIFPQRSLMPGTVNYSILGDNMNQSFIIEPQIEYKQQIGHHSFNIMAGGTYQTRLGESTTIQASNFKLESLMEDLGSAGTIDTRASSYGMYKYASIFGRFSYNFSQTYVLNATFRRDGSSRFGPGNRYGNFGSVAGAWIFSNLNMFKAARKYLSHGKLRMSYGTTGNDQIPDYQYLSTYSSPSTNIYQDVLTMKPSRISNADFKWETTRKLDIALELGFLNDRISFIGEYYQNNSKDQLINYSLPQMTGFASYQANLPAVVRNTGLELSLNAKVIELTKFNWTANLNVTFPKNQLRSFENFETSSYAKIYELGYDITRIYGAKSLGLNQSTGQVDYSGPDGAASSNPYQFFTLGRQTPDFFGGIGNTFSYGPWQLDLFAQFSKQVALGALNGNFGALPFNNFKAVLNRSFPEGPISKFPMASLTYDSNLANSDLNIFNTSYLRIKTIYFSYQLPEQLLKSLHLTGLKLYASGQNLISVWNKKSAVYDPESGVLGNVPPMKSLVFGLQLSL
jgi:TonB-linked SusC/RagA family outer membrane protein